MNIVFFSTNSNTFPHETFRITRAPLHRNEWEAVAKEFLEHRFTIVTQMPCMFLADIMTDGSILKAKGINYIICKENSVEEMCNVILEQKPDIALAVSFWQPPYDWNCLKDAMIAEALESYGIKTLCHSSQTMNICFNKIQTEEFLKSNGFRVPRSVHVSHELFWTERSHGEIKSNVYKEYVLSQIQALTFPVIIKDTVGLSSYGMEVARTYKEAVHYLRSGKTHSDRIVQEYIEGVQFGTEIYGSPGSYTILPPFAFSVNRFGITSPKQGIKVGPAKEDAENLRLKELYEMLNTLAQNLNLKGIAQVDLILSRDGWYILEVNPRLSGMTETYAACYRTTVSRMLVNLALGKNPFTNEPISVCNFKLPLISEEEQKKILSRPDVHFLRQTQNTLARQEREKGYCEIVFGRGKELSSLKEELFLLQKECPHLVDEGFLRQATGMIGLLDGTSKN